MKIKLIDFGLEKDHYPFRPHENDAGADVYMPYDCTLKPGEIARIPLGFGLMIPDGYAVFGPAIGVLVDRHDRKKIMIGADLIIAAAGAVLAIVALYMELLLYL